MENIDPNIERLMNRRLDGEITEDELLALNHELIRNPAAHRLWEEYLELDARAGEAINNVFSGSPLVMDTEALPLRPVSIRFSRLRRHGLLLAGAVAAAVLALAIPHPAVTPNDNAKTASNKTIPAPQVDVARPTDPSPVEGLMRNVSTPQIRRNTGREVFGVLGEDGNIYWIEVDRTRTLRRPPVENLPRDLRETL